MNVLGGVAVSITFTQALGLSEGAGHISRVVGIAFGKPSINVRFGVQPQRKRDE